MRILVNARSRTSPVTIARWILGSLGNGTSASLCDTPSCTSTLQPVPLRGETQKSARRPWESQFQTLNTVYNTATKQRNTGPKIKCGGTDMTSSPQPFMYANAIKSSLLKFNRLSSLGRQVLHNQIYGGLSRLRFLELERCHFSEKSQTQRGYWCKVQSDNHGARSLREKSPTLAAPRGLTVARAPFWQTHHKDRWSSWWPSPTRPPF